MKKRLFAPIIAFVALCLVALTACGGPSAEDMIREDLTAQFEEVKAGSDDLMDGIEEGAGEDFATLGVDPRAFAESFLEGFDYEIGDITVEDTTATANVSITVKSMGDIMNEFQLQYADYLSNLSELPSQEDLYHKAGEMLIDATATVEPKTTDCTFTYTQDDEGEWSADESAETELINALMS